MQQRYNWEETHAILFIFPGFAVLLKTSRILTWPNKYLFDGAGKGQDSRTEVDKRDSSSNPIGIVH